MSSESNKRILKSILCIWNEMESNGMEIIDGIFMDRWGVSDSRGGDDEKMVFVVLLGIFWGFYL